jgi:hypothetical protein
MTPVAVTLTLDLLALMGVGAYVLGQIGWRNPTPVSIRLTALMLLLVAFISLRIARSTLDYAWSVRIEEAIAAFIPLFALVLAEGMMRRHSPGLLKLLMALGSFALAIGAMVRPSDAQVAFSLFLGPYIVGALLIVCLLLVTRRRSSLSTGENSAISAFFCGLLFSLPFGITDFLATMGVLPIGVSSLAMLVFLFFASHVTIEGDGGLAAIGELAWAILASAAAYIALGYVSGWPVGVDRLQLAAVLLGLLLTFRIIQYVREQRKTRARQTLWRAFAKAPSNNLEAFLDTILSAEEFASAQVLQDHRLADYDHDQLRRLFAMEPVIAASATRRRSEPEYQQLAVIFAQYQATHIVLIRAEPLALLLVNMPRVGAGIEIDDQLAIVARLATQIPPRPV